MKHLFNAISSGFQRFAAMIPARFHIAAGLTSLLTSLILVSYFVGFVPDRSAIKHEGRIALSEALAASGSSSLERGDLDGMRRVLEFVVDRNSDLSGIELVSKRSDQVVTFGEVPDGGEAAVDGEASSSGDVVIVPLMRGRQDWGQLRFHYLAHGVQGGLSGAWDKFRDSPFGFMAFAGLLAFPLFLFYLGRVLKQLDPKAAVPGRVRSALDSIAECLVVLDRRGQLVLANAAFCTLSGRSVDSLIGKSIDSMDWADDEGDEQVDRPWVHALETGDAVHQAKASYTDTDGVRRSFLVNCSPVQGAEGQIGGVLVSMDDVTELEEQERALRVAMLMAEEASVAKSAFLSNMSHEIRTPLTAILGFTDVLRRGSSIEPEDRERHLQTISNSGTHLLSLINDLLDLSKVESGAMEVEFLETSVVDIALDVAEVLRVKADEKGIALNVDINGAFPETVSSDPSRLRQIITNLVGNAIKFTDEGSVSMCLSFNEADQSCRISVADTGIGMTPEQQTRVFDAFSQADETVSRRFGGTGLGLSISLSLAEALGGGVSVESVLGEGSQFHVDIPTGDLAGVPMLTAADLSSRVIKDKTQSDQDWRFPAVPVLVVDDAAENRELLSLVLSGLGLHVHTATNGKEAVDAVSKADFKVILMDIQMPVMDGYEAIGILRERGVDLPVIGLTADAMRGVEERVLTAGFSHYMTKPIDIDGLTELLASLLGAHIADGDASGQLEHSEESVPLADLKAAEQVTISEDAGTSAADEADTPVVSSLITGNSRFMGIVERFIPRLEEQLIALDQHVADGNLDETAAIAHWLKGSGGSVGFGGFTKPAAQLQAAAENGDMQEIQVQLHTLNTYAARVRAGWEQSTGLHSDAADSARSQAQ